MLFPELNHMTHEIMDFLEFLKPAPVEPGNDIVLTIRVVVSKLGVTELIARKKHRRATAAQKCCKCIFYKAPSKSVYIWIVCLALCATVPAMSVVVSVCVIPAVFLIVLFIV